MLFHMPLGKHQTFLKILKYFVFLNFKNSLIFDLVINLLQHFPGYLYDGSTATFMGNNTKVSESRYTKEFLNRLHL